MKPILVIDDDEHIRRVIEILLIQQGFEIVPASSGEEGLEKLETLHPSMIICDVMMSGIDGYEFTVKVREMGAFNDVPIVLLTAKTDDDDIKEGYHKGADYYLTKPFTKEQLVYGVNLMLGDQTA